MYLNTFKYDSWVNVYLMCNDFNLGLKGIVYLIVKLYVSVGLKLENTFTSVGSPYDNVLDAHIIFGKDIAIMS